MLLNTRYIPPRETLARCQVCQDLNLQEPSIKGMLGIPLDLLRKSSRDGCSWCGLLEAALDLPDLEPPAGQSLFGVTLFAENGTQELHAEEKPLPLIMRLQTEYWNYAEVEIFTEQGHPCPAPAIGPARTISKDASSAECVSLMKSWLSDCLLQHRTCPSTTTPVLPDRVLNVERGQDPRLHITKPDEPGVYAALSHCWGGTVPLRLTDDNMDDLKKGIAWKTLPKTFQDAIEVCRLLDIRYLWIDSLCIIQTSAADWDAQGSKMHTVYSQALLVIAADGASNSAEGFIRHTKRDHPLLKLPYKPGKHLNSGGSVCHDGQPIYARRRGVGDRDAFVHHSRRGEYRSSLSLRGWVLQESILARRIIHFTAEEVTWECNESSRCECQIAPHTSQSAGMVPLKKRQHPTSSHVNDWPKLVQDFTCRNLTYSTDRLAAMSGLAASLQPRDRAIVYYAGLWSDSLPQSLYWFCIPHGPDLPVSARKSQRIVPPCAPSWSWASVSGRVIMRNIEPEDTLRDIQVSCPPSGKNKYGSVSGATLTANACLVEGKVFHDPKSTGESQFQVQFWSRGDRKQLLPPVGGTFLDVIGSENMEIEGGDEVSLVVHSSNTFLMLRLDSALTGGTYRRVGVLVCDSFPGDCCPPEWRTITLV